MKVFNRLNEEHKSIRHNVIWDTLKYMYITRDGISVSDIMHILQISAMDWSQISLSINDFLVSKQKYCILSNFSGGTIAIQSAYHDAICTQFTENELRSARIKLIQYFTDSNNRRVYTEVHIYFML